MTSSQSVYRSFLLRCWLEIGQDGLASQWRFSLEEVGHPDQQGFASLEALVNYLQNLTPTTQPPR